MQLCITGTASHPFFDQASASISAKGGALETKYVSLDTATGLEYLSGAEGVDFDHPDRKSVGSGLLVAHWLRILPRVPPAFLKFGLFALVGNGGERAVGAEHCSRSSLDPK